VESTLSFQFDGDNYWETGIKREIYGTAAHPLDTYTVYYLLFDKTKYVSVRNFEIISNKLKVGRIYTYVVGLGTSKIYYSSNNNNVI
jgi:hypothetical protein